MWSSYSTSWAGGACTDSLLKPTISYAQSDRVDMGWLVITHEGCFADRITQLTIQWGEVVFLGVIAVICFGLAYLLIRSLQPTIRLGVIIGWGVIVVVSFGHTYSIIRSLR